MAALDAVEAAGRWWPYEKPRRLWRGKQQTGPDSCSTDRALTALAPGEMLLLARPDDDNGETIDDYLEEHLAGFVREFRHQMSPSFGASRISPFSMFTSLGTTPVGRAEPAVDQHPAYAP